MRAARIASLVKGCYCATNWALTCKMLYLLVTVSLMYAPDLLRELLQSWYGVGVLHHESGEHESQGSSLALVALPCDCAHAVDTVVRPVPCRPEWSRRRHPGIIAVAAP